MTQSVRCFPQSSSPKVFMLIYRSSPYFFLRGISSRAATCIRADWPSGKFPTSLVRRRISRLSRSSGLLSHSGKGTPPPLGGGFSVSFVICGHEQLSQRLPQCFFNSPAPGLDNQVPEKDFVRRHRLEGQVADTRHLRKASGGNSQRTYSTRPYPSFRFDSAKPCCEQVDATTERPNLPCHDKRISIVAPPVLGTPYVGAWLFLLQ